MKAKRTLSLSRWWHRAAAEAELLEVSWLIFKAIWGEEQTSLNYWDLVWLLTDHTRLPPLPAERSCCEGIQVECSCHLFPLPIFCVFLFMWRVDMRGDYFYLLILFCFQFHITLASHILDWAFFSTFIYIFNPASGNTQPLVKSKCESVKSKEKIYIWTC